MTTKKSITSHEPTHHVTNEGDQAMSTTTKIHSTHAKPNATRATTPPARATPTATTPPSASTLAYIQTCISLLDQIDAVFPPTDSLTARDKKHTAKARKGSERFAPQLVALAKQYGVNLSLVPLDEISNASAQATALVPLQKRIEALNTRTSTLMFSLQSATWSGSAKLYSVLRRLSKDNGEIETGLAPVERFFNHRSPAVAKNHPKTKKGKAALAAKTAAAATSEPAPAAVPLATAVATPASAPAASPVLAPVPTAPSTNLATQS